MDVFHSMCLYLTAALERQIAAILCTRKDAIIYRQVCTCMIYIDIQ